MNGRSGVCAMVLLTATALAGPFAARAQDHQAAVWHAHELDFQYMGLASQYSCSGLQSAMREILLDLGAREDQLVVVPGACSSGFDGRPSRISGVHIKMATLQPTASGEQGPAVDASWKAVTIGGRSSGADCDLIEQVRTDILPLFTTRNVKRQNTDCIPHQATLPPPKMTLEVLAPAR